MMARLSSITSPSEVIKTGTVAFGEAATRAGGLLRSATSRHSTSNPNFSKVQRARMA